MNHFAMKDVAVQYYYAEAFVTKGALTQQYH